MWYTNLITNPKWNNNIDKIESYYLSGCIRTGVLLTCSICTLTINKILSKLFHIQRVQSTHYFKDTVQMRVYVVGKVNLMCNNVI